MMNIDHIHFYVEDAVTQRNWFMKTMGWQPVNHFANDHTAIEILKSGSVYFVLSAPKTSHSPVVSYLKRHPAGVVDIAFRVPAIAPLLANSANIRSPIQTHVSTQGSIHWAQVAGWGSLRHTLIEATTTIPFWDVFLAQRSLKENQPAPDLQPAADQRDRANSQTSLTFGGIDHVVLNVPAGELESAVRWYQDLFGFQVQQTFNIQTKNSGLSSKVLKSSDGQIYFNINEPTSANSQIQEFLDANRGAGIQHIALKTANIVQAVQQMRQRGLSFLSVPATYYTQLKQRLQCAFKSRSPLTEFQDVMAQQILVDWHEDAPDSLLLQIFSRPIFDQSTFFLS